MLKAATIALNGNRPGVCDEDYRGIICWPRILELAAPSQNRAKTLEIPKPGRNHRNKICPHGFISAGQIKSSVCVFISVIACGSWVKQVCPLVGLACVTPQLQKLSTPSPALCHRTYRGSLYGDTNFSNDFFSSQCWSIVLMLIFFRKQESAIYDCFCFWQFFGWHWDTKLNDWVSWLCFLQCSCIIQKSLTIFFCCKSIFFLHSYAFQYPIFEYEPFMRTSLKNSWARSINY